LFPCRVADTHEIICARHDSRTGTHMLNSTVNTITNQQLTKREELVKTAHLEIRKMWDIFSINEHSVLEIRALWPKYIKTFKSPIVEHFRGQDYDSVVALAEAFELTALKLNEVGYNIYIVMNPIRSSYFGEAISDDDIQYRDLLLIDIDRAISAKEPANEQELDAARQLAKEVQEFMEGSGFNNPFKVMSGNGYHLYYLLIEQDTGNTPESEQMVQRTLKSLAKKFDNKIVKIDTTVFNAGRITKVPGTIMRKGYPSETRPYRMAVVL
jgi:hypothetical protein